MSSIKKLSYTILLSVMILSQFLFGVPKAQAIGLSFSGRQVMWWPMGTVCTATDMHFILVNGTRLLTLYWPPAVIPKSGNLMLMTQQVGTYLPIPVPCVNASGVTVGTTMGTYTMVAASMADIGNKNLFAGLMSPFFADINS